MLGSSVASAARQAAAGVIIWVGAPAGGGLAGLQQPSMALTALGLGRLFNNQSFEVG